jgi:hypothetical protein
MPAAALPAVVIFVLFAATHARHTVDYVTTPPQLGLCALCAHALVRPTNKGTVYLRCARAASDPGFARYPRLPVLSCRGYEQRRDSD